MSFQLNMTWNRIVYLSIYSAMVPFKTWNPSYLSTSAMIPRKACLPIALSTGVDESYIRKRPRQRHASATANGRVRLQPVAGAAVVAARSPK